MAIRIIRRPHDFLLVGKRRQFSLSVSCGEALRSYNATDQLPETDAALYARFADARNEAALVTAIDKLLRDYGLNRRPAFTAKQFAPVLVSELEGIRQGSGNANPNEITSIDRIITSFSELTQRFTERLQRKELLPEVTLSKLLHFIRPESYWIVDSRVKTLLFIWGYSESFRGFGEFLKHLFRDTKFRQFERFLRDKERALIMDRPVPRGGTPLLKLIDKALWSRQA
jgi:hypothetical protein